MSNRGGRSGTRRGGGGGGPGRNPNNRTQNNKPQNSPKPQQPQLSENELSLSEPTTASLEVKSSPAPQPETSSPPTTTTTTPSGGGKNPPPKNQKQQQKKPTQPPAKKEPAPKTTTPGQTKQPQQNPKPQGGQQQQGGKKTGQQQQPAAKTNPPAAKKNTKKPAPTVVDDESDKDPSINIATSGVFQFGQQPVHGFTPMSFNFSLPAANEVPPVEPELPSHSGPCVVTTGGVTYELEQKSTVTLEENEDAVFVGRAKLYRYDSETGEWKERGVGDYKVLKHKETGKYRILMRRDKIHKVCANHNVPPVELKPHPTFPETCWVYQTDSDFSEEVVKKSTFAVRFQNVETAQQFLTIYNNARASMGIAVEEEKVVPHSKEKEEVKVVPHTKEEVHEQIIEIKSDMGLGASPVPEEITLDFLYKEILEIKSAIKTIQQDILQLKFPANYY